MHKLEGYNVLWGSEVKDQEREHKKRKCYNFLEKIVLDTSSIPAHIYFIFKSVWSNLKLDGSTNYSFVKCLCIPKIEKATIKDFRLNILSCFNSHTVKHWAPSHQTPPHLPFLYQIEKFLWYWKH
jgi:hypothetical protein